MSVDPINLLHPGSRIPLLHITSLRTNIQHLYFQPRHRGFPIGTSVAQAIIRASDVCNLFAKPDAVVLVRCVQVEDGSFGIGEVVVAGEEEVGGEDALGGGRRGREREDCGGYEGEEFGAGG